MTLRTPASRLTLLTALAGAALAAGCGRHGKGAPAGGSDLPPSKVNLRRNVSLARSEKRPLCYHVETVGVLEPEGTTDIAAGVSGLVDEVLFREGDDVSPGQNEPLVRIDRKRYETALRQAEATEGRAAVALEQAKDELNRVGKVGVSATDQERKRAEFGQQLAEAELQVARSALALAKLNYQKSQVRPPYRGRINRRMVTPGTYVEDKTVIATMADLSRLRLVGYVPETATPMLRQLMRRRSP